MKKFTLAAAVILAGLGARAGAVPLTRGWVAPAFERTHAEGKRAARRDNEFVRAASSVYSAHKAVARSAVDGGLVLAGLAAGELKRLYGFLEKTLVFSTRLEENAFFIAHKVAVMAADRETESRWDYDWVLPPSEMEALRCAPAPSWLPRSR